MGKGNAASAMGTLPAGPAPSFRSVASSRVVWISLALTAAIVFVYAHAPSHDYVAWDDPAYVSENLRVAAGLTADGIRWAFTTASMGNWHPLTWLSYMLGAQLFGMSAGAHVLVNVLLHTFNSLLLFALLRRMTGALWRSALVAALFAVHPLHVESVVWVSERKDVLSTLLGFLGLWAYLDYARAKSKGWYIAVLVFFVLGLMAKPMLVTLPFVMMLLDYWPLRRPGRPLVREKIPLLALAAIAGVAAMLAQQQGGAVAAFERLPLGSRVANAIVAYAAYIGKMLWPAHLSAFYPLHPLTAGTVASSALLLMALSAGALLCARHHPYVTVGWLWYLITLAPVIGIIQVGSQSMADRYTYIPSVGLFIVAAWGCADLLDARPAGKFALTAAVAAILLACTAMARTQAEYWTNSKTLWAHALTVDADDDTAHRLLADALLKEGRREEAIDHYSAALRIRPSNADAHNGLGLALAGQGKYGQAIAEYAEAERLKPLLVDAHVNMGLALAAQQKLGPAIDEYNIALRIDPDFVNGRLSLALALAHTGRPNEAIAQYEEVLRLHPDNASAHNNLGVVLSGQGRIREAIAQFAAAVQARPDFAAARANLKQVMAQSGGAAPAR